MQGYTDGSVRCGASGQWDSVPATHCQTDEPRSIHLLAVLEKEIEVARGNLGALHQSMHRVLTPVGPGTGKDGCEKDTRVLLESPLSEQIRALTFSVTHLASEIRDIQSRMTI